MTGIEAQVDTATSPHDVKHRTGNAVDRRPISLSAPLLPPLQISALSPTVIRDRRTRCMILRAFIALHRPPEFTAAFFAKNQA